MSLKPLDDRVVVEPTSAEEQTAGGIVLPDAAQEKSQRGKVIAVGPGPHPRRRQAWRSLASQIGDEVLFGKYGGTEIEVDGKDLKILRESDILAKIVEVAGTIKSRLATRAGSQPELPRESLIVAKQLLFDDRARIKLQRGVKILADAVAVTMGPTGRNVIIDKSFGNPLVTKDGVTVSKEVELEDPIEHMGAKLVNEVASKTSDIAGDGTTTATVLARAIYDEGLRSITLGSNPMIVRRGIDKAVEAAIAAFRRPSKPVESKEEIAQVGAISANNDQAIGNLIADAMERVGRDGVITVEEGKGGATTLEFAEGMQFDKGYISPYFVTTPANMTCVLENCLILIYEKKISSLRDFVPVLEKVAQSGKPLLVIAEDVEGEALTALVVNRLRGVLSICAVKAPGFGDRRKAMLGDIAVLTGGTLISEDLGIKLENVELKHLGQAKKTEVTKDACTIIEGAGDKKAIQARVQQIPHADRADRQRVRSREIPGTPRQADRRRRRDFRWGRHRSRNEADQGPHGRRPARDAGGCRGGYSSRRRRRPVAIHRGGQRGQSQRRRADRRRYHRPGAGSAHPPDCQQQRGRRLGRRRRSSPEIGQHRLRREHRRIRRHVQKGDCRPDQGREERPTERGLDRRADADHPGAGHPHRRGRRRRQAQSRGKYPLTGPKK